LICLSKVQELKMAKGIDRPRELLCFFLRLIVILRKQKEYSRASFWLQLLRESNYEIFSADRCNALISQNPKFHEMCESTASCGVKFGVWNIYNFLTIIFTDEL